MMTKTELKEELCSQLRETLQSLERAAKSTREAATHEEAKPENDKDTRALEQSYLARGQAMRVEELRTGLADVTAMGLRVVREGDPIGLGVLVTAEEGEASIRLFIAPYGGGLLLASGAVQVVTPKSPLGKALIGLRVDDECTVPIAGRVRELLVVGVE